MSNNLVKVPESTKTDGNSNIMSFILQYIELYIKHKQSCNVAKNTIYNINSALERFLTFISGKQLHQSKVITIRHKQILCIQLHLNCLYGV